MKITKAMFVDLLMRSKVMVTDTRAEYNRVELDRVVTTLIGSWHSGKACIYTPLKISADRIQLIGKTRGDSEVIVMYNSPQSRRAYHLYASCNRLILQQTTNYLDGEVKSTLHRYFILL